MAPNRKITFVEVPRKRFFELQDILDTGLLGPIAVTSIAGGVAYVLTNSGESAMRVMAGVCFVSVWLEKRIKKAQKAMKGKQ